MLRSTVLVLMLANAGYYAWSHGLLPLGHSTSTEESEPQRLAQQLHPEALHILPKAGSNPSTARSPEDTPPSPPVAPEPQPEVATTTTPPTAPPAPAPATETAAPAPAPTPAPPPAVAALAATEPDSKPEAKTPAKPEPSNTICLQAGAFDATQADVLRKALDRLPADSWNLSHTTLPGRWMVYMGRFPDLDSLNKKRNELRDRDVSYDRPRIAALEPGLSLGRFSTEEAAERALAQLGTKGVRSARVVQERAETQAFVLRLPAVAVDARQRITTTLRPVLAGKTLRPC